VLRRRRHGSSVDILSPAPGQRVGESGLVEGRATVVPNSYLWVLVHRKDVEGWWPQGGGSIPGAGGRWSAQVDYGGPHDAGCEFEIAAVIVSRAVHDRWLEWVQSVRDTGAFPPVRLPAPPGVLAETYRTVRKQV
jgi:hypothetical protein